MEEPRKLVPALFACLGIHWPFICLLLYVEPPSSRQTFSELSVSIDHDSIVMLCMPNYHLTENRWMNKRSPSGQNIHQLPSVSCAITVLQSLVLNKDIVFLALLLFLSFAMFYSRHHTYYFLMLIWVSIYPLNLNYQ